MTAEGFIKELKRLMLAQPKYYTQIINSENCEYCANVYYSKDLYYCFDCTKSTKGIYMFDAHNFHNCADCDFTYETESSYECVDAYKCFNCTYLEYCENMTDSHYSYDCRNCHDVFGCVHLYNKSFCIFNRQFSEEEYREKVKYLKTLPPEKILEQVNKMKLKHPVTQTRSHDNVNSGYGNYVYFCNNCYMCFDIENTENGGYLYDSGRNKNVYDVTQSIESELSYEILDSGQIFNSDHIVFSSHCVNCSYVFNCSDVKDSLGCINLTHKQYCILNRQFTKEEYEKISVPLLEDLKKKNLGWGSLVF